MSYLQSVAQVNVQIAEIKGLYNQELADLCLAWRDKKISDDPNATGNEDSRIPDHQYVDQLKEKVTTIFHADVDDRYFLSSQIWKDLVYDKSVDIYSFGILIYELFENNSVLDSFTRCHFNWINSILNFSVS